MVAVLSVIVLLVDSLVTSQQHTAGTHTADSAEEGVAALAAVLEAATQVCIVK